MIEQIFNLAYYGRMDPVYTTNIATEDRNQLLKLLVDTKKKEKDNYEKAERPRQPHVPKVPTNVNPRIKFNK